MNLIDSFQKEKHKWPVFKECLMSLAIREMQIKSTWRYPSSELEWLSSTNLAANIGENRTRKKETCISCW